MFFLSPYDREIDHKMLNQLLISVDATSANDVKTTSCQSPGAMTSHRRWYDVVLTSYVPSGYLPAREISSQTYIEGKFRIRDFKRFTKK